MEEIYYIEQSHGFYYILKNVQKSFDFGFPFDGVGTYIYSSNSNLERVFENSKNEVINIIMENTRKLEPWEVVLFKLEGKIKNV